MRFFHCNVACGAPVDQLRAQTPSISSGILVHWRINFRSSENGRREVSDRCRVPLPREPPQLCHDFDPFEVCLRLQDTCAHTPPGSVLLSLEHVTPRRPAVSRQPPP